MVYPLKVLVTGIIGLVLIRYLIKVKGTNNFSKQILIPS